MIRERRQLTIPLKLSKAAPWLREGQIVEFILDAPDKILIRPIYRNDNNKSV